MPSYKVIYYNATWEGEPIRFMLSYLGIKFDDVRHSVESFEAVKEDYPIQNLPVLEIDGKQYFQCAVICRLLANKFGLASTSDEEKAEADMAVDTIIDLREEFNCLYFEKDDAVRASKAKEIRDGHGKIFFTYLNGQASANGGYLVGKNVTWADLFFSAEYDVFLKYLGTDIFDNFPALIELNNKVRAIPNIATWVASRPVGED